MSAFQFVLNDHVSDSFYAMGVRLAVAIESGDVSERFDIEIEFEASISDLQCGSVRRAARSSYNKGAEDTSERIDLYGIGSVPTSGRTVPAELRTFVI